jgi:membrane peptidoglycan carboxypeptidase
MVGKVPVTAPHQSLDGTLNQSFRRFGHKPSKARCAAARIYFNKDIGGLSLSESAMLAGLLRAPSQWNPIDNFEGARRCARRWWTRRK